MSRLCPLFSGSRGNSIYVESANTGVLIDVGRSSKQMELSLEKNKIDVSQIKAILITHEHTDHIQGLRVFAAKHHIKIYASAGTIRALENKLILTNNLDYEILNNTINVCDLKISSFKTSHDCAEGLGYIIETFDNNKVAIATDLGVISDNIREAIASCNIAVIESNHDMQMLLNGPYPYYLKKRILSEYGHLSNEACANVLPDLVKKGVTRFILAHLSGENNVPELAYETAVSSLNACGLVNGVDYEIMIAPKENLGSKTIFF